MQIYTVPTTRARDSKHVPETDFGNIQKSGRFPLPPTHAGAREARFLRTWVSPRSFLRFTKNTNRSNRMATCCTAENETGNGRQWLRIVKVANGHLIKPRNQPSNSQKTKVDNVHLSSSKPLGRQWPRIVKMAQCHFIKPRSSKVANSHLAKPHHHAPLFSKNYITEC